MSYPRVHITEECLREGMQIESKEIALEDKVRLLDALSQTGLRTIMVGSFVSPRYTPQMAEIERLLAKFSPAEGVRYVALALNAKGAQRAAAFMPPLSPRDVPPMLLTHLCDTFTRRNANRSQQREIDSWPAIIAAARRDRAPRVALAVNAAFGSNFAGPFSLGQRMELLSRQHEAWSEAGMNVTGVLLGDPMSWCMPQTMEEQLGVIRATWPQITHFYLHLHDARGLALTTTYEALRFLEAGDDLYLDTTIGGVGGCPYCGNGRATGMAATEDVVNLLDELGIDTGIDLDKLIDAVWMLEDILGRPVPGHVAKAGPMPRGDRRYDPNLHFVETFDEAKHFRFGKQVADHHMYPWREPIPPPP